VQLDEEAKSMLANYPWRGNVRELKNIAEQISVLTKNSVINASELQPYLTDKPFNYLPVLANQHQGGATFVSETTFANERDILYKFIFDLKKDVNEMKRMFLELVNNPGQVSTSTLFHDDPMHSTTSHRGDTSISNTLPTVVNSAPSSNAPTPILVQSGASGAKAGNDFDQHEEVDESLNIMEMEKDLIIKALKKHRNKRKDAALDLGISERTLYRKLKEYDIEDLYQQPKSGLKTYR
jgi:DNA-binding NtrC family response regulator